MSDIVLLGGNILNGGIFSNKEKYGVDRIFVFDWNENVAIKGDYFTQCDIKDWELILKYLKRYSVKELRFVYTSADLGVPAQQAIHRAYGLKDVDIRAVEKTLYKSEMTRIWKEKKLLNRENYVFKKPIELERLDRSTEWIVKPNLCSGSRGITILPKDCSLLDLEKAFKRAVDASWDDKVIVEEFVHGIEFTVEMLGDFFGNVSVWGVSKKYHTIYNKKNKIATKLHYNPFDVADNVLKKLGEYGVECYKALGLNGGLGHLEVILTEDGKISPLEMGARSSGYIASHCIDSVCDESYLNTFAKILRGGRVEKGYRMNAEKSSMLYFYDMPDGNSVNEGNIMEFLPESITSLAADRTRIKAGMKYAAIDGDGERFGFEIFEGRRKSLTVENINIAQQELIKKMYGI